MGMKHVSWLLAALIVISIGTFFYGTIMCLVIGLLNLKSSSFTILIISVLAFVYASVFQAAFFLLGLGKVGFVIAAFINIAQFIVSIFFNEGVMTSSNIIRIVGILMPQLSFQSIIRTIYLFETRGGIQWKNLNSAIQNNNVQDLIISLCATFGVYFLATIWIWPIRFSRDGKKRSVCYCFFPSNWG